MFENIYTTKMSDGKKALQRRFTRIRHRTSRASRIAAAAASAALIFGTVCTASAVSAMNSGLEHWVSDEIYMDGAMRFSINIGDTDVPDWISGIDDGDGVIDVNVIDCTWRNVKGNLSGITAAVFNGGKASLMMQANVGFGDDNNKNIYTKAFGGSLGAEKNPFGLSADDGRHAYFEFALDNDLNISGVKLKFFTEEPHGFNGSADMSGAFVIDDPDMTSGFERMCGDSMRGIGGSAFTGYELNNYIKRHADGIEIAVAAANEESITVSADISLDAAANVQCSVFNSDGVKLSCFYGYECTDGTYTNKYDNGYSDISSDGKAITLYAPLKRYESFNSDFPSAEQTECRFIAGETYRVETVVYDSEQNIIYRQMDYVTV